MSKITVTISGPIGCGKSAVAGEIEIALRAIGVPVSFDNPKAALSEKNMTGADWQTYLEMYQPTVVIVEMIEAQPLYTTPPAPQPTEREKVLEERLQAIIDWADIAMKNADEFDSHGVRNLDGPVFDAARAALASPEDGSASV